MVKVRFRLDFAPGVSVGPGKIELLGAIEATGSLSAAARRLGMSYRRAWLLLDSLNRSFDAPVTRASVGGRGGGGVAVTPFGQELLALYARLAAEIGALADRRLGGIATASRPGQGRQRARRAAIRPSTPTASRRPPAHRQRDAGKQP